MIINHKQIDLAINNLADILQQNMESHCEL